MEKETIMNTYKAIPSSNAEAFYTQTEWILLLPTPPPSQTDVKDTRLRNITKADLLEEKYKSKLKLVNTKSVWEALNYFLNPPPYIFWKDTP